MAESSVEANPLGSGQLLDYNEDERRYGGHVRDMLLELLSGDRSKLELATKYHREPGRLGVMAVPLTVDARRLRLQRVEDILSNTIRFLYDGSQGGPIAQTEDRGQGTILQSQDFTTRFPHIVMQKTDAFDAASGEPVRSSWSVRRLQNHRAHLKVNRALDIVNVGLGLAGLAR